MFIKIFGILDILIASIILIQNYFFSLFPSSVIWAAAIYLFVKGIAFVILLDFASLIDIVCSIIIILTIFLGVPKLLIGLVIFWLAQKGFFSLWS